ncbi:MAG: glycerol kinase GlpK [Baekduia sp.]
MILAIDQGTTGSRAFVFGEDGAEVASAYSEFTQHFPEPGWVEHDAAEIWQVTERVCREALAGAGIDGSSLSSIGITNQRETSVAWNRSTGEPLCRAIVWQDRRTAERCDELRAAGHERFVRERTGLVLDAYFSATKYAWMLEHAIDSDAGDVAFGTIDAWLLFKLTGEHATDSSNASRTLLLDIGSCDWDDELCALFGVPRGSLPEVRPVLGEFGRTSLFGGDVPVCAMAGDQQAALYGQACHARGEAKNTYGTGCFLLQNAGQDFVLADGLVTTIAWSDQAATTYALESSIFVAGSAIQWLRDGLGIIASAAESEALAASLDSNDGVYFVPALVGLGSPHWDPYARGTIVGLTRGTGREHIVRAALEAVAHQTADAVEAQSAASGAPLPELRVDGGMVHNRWLMQFQADLLGVPVVVPRIADTTVLGAAYMAGIASGLWTRENVRSMWNESERYEPQMSRDHAQTLRSDWARAVERSRGWAAPPEAGA